MEIISRPVIPLVNKSVLLSNQEISFRWQKMKQSILLVYHHEAKGGRKSSLERGKGRTNTEVLLYLKSAEPMFNSRFWMRREGAILK